MFQNLIFVYLNLCGEMHCSKCKLKDDFNLLFIQYCFRPSSLPIDYALDLRKLCFLPRDAYA